MAMRCSLRFAFVVLFAVCSAPVAGYGESSPPTESARPSTSHIRAGPTAEPSSRADPTGPGASPRCMARSWKGSGATAHSSEAR